MFRPGWEVEGSYDALFAARGAEVWIARLPRPLNYARFLRTDAETVAKRVQARRDFYRWHPTHKSLLKRTANHATKASEPRNFRTTPKGDSQTTRH